MKWVGYILVPVLLLAGVAWWAVYSVPSELAPEPAASGAPRHAHPYPADMWKQLAYLPGLRVMPADELPADLAWQDGADEPPLGSPQARKGGVVRLCSVGPFPANLLALGSPTPQFFHANAFERVEIPLVQRQPATGGLIPGVAQAWAVQGRTVYFRLHPAARYSNGRPVRAADYALGVLLRQRAGESAAWVALCHAAEELRIYGDSVLSLTLRREMPLAPLCAAALLHAAEPGFYAEFGSDYTTRYAWRIPPTTGAYTIGRVLPGRMIELRHVADWWAADLPHYRFVCNVDCLEYHFLTDEAQGWEFFLRGKLDVMQTRHLAAWQRYLPGGEAPAGVVSRSFRVPCLLPPYGIALNTKTLPDIELRRGWMQALDMDRVVELLFRGEADRLPTFTAGYGELSPAHTSQYSFDPAAARACFARAGYTEVGQDGILRRPDGTRLSAQISYVPSEKLGVLVSVLKRSAAACGAELVPDPLPWQLCAERVRDGRHQLTFWATVPAQPLPDPARYFHSRARGDDAPFGLHDEEMDAALYACAAARSPDELAAALARVDARVYELAIWLPGWQENRAYIAHWSRVCFPEAPGAYYDVVDNHTLWCEEGREP